MIIVGDNFVLEPGELLVVAMDMDLNGVVGASLGGYHQSVFCGPDNMTDFVQWVTDQQAGRSNEARTRRFAWVSGLCARCAKR